MLLSVRCRSWALTRHRGGDEFSDLLRRFDQVRTGKAGVVRRGAMPVMGSTTHSLALPRPPATKSFDNSIAESDDFPVLVADQRVILHKNALMPLFNCHGIALQFFLECLTFFA